MANKQSFTPEEWTKILESPMVVGYRRFSGGPQRRVGVSEGSFRE